MPVWFGTTHLRILRVRLPGVTAGDVLGNELDVSGHQIVKRLGRVLLVERILLDDLIERSFRSDGVLLP